MVFLFIDSVSAHSCKLFHAAKLQKIFHIYVYFLIFYVDFLPNVCKYQKKNVLLHRILDFIQCKVKIER